VSGIEQDLNGTVSLEQDFLDTAALNRETFDIEDVAWSNNEFQDSIATAARNGKIMLYNIHRPGMDIARLHEHLQQVHKVDFNPLEGGILLSGSQDGTVRLWDLRSLQRSAMVCSSRDTFHGRSQSVRHVKWSPTSTWTFAFSTDNGGLQRWDTRNNRIPLLKIHAHDGHCNTIDWHPDGRHLATAGEDRTIKVWNMAPDEPRQKAQFTLRTPFGVQNVRWRPSCFMPDEPEEGSKHCTHIASSYRNYPVVHVWDLRRPYIPFKEIHHTHNSGTTDMLWRTRDLLWTVGVEGEFTQTDIPHAPKTIERRPTSTFAISASNELNFCTMKRNQIPIPMIDLVSRGTKSELAQRPQGPGTHELPFGRSPGDDIAEERLSGEGKGRLKVPSTKMRSAGTTPPSIEDTKKSDTVDLFYTMYEYNSIKPWQLPKVGAAPGAAPDLVNTYMTQRCKGPPTDQPMELDYVLNLRTLFDRNAAYAQRASLFREAQTWRIMGAQLEKDLRARAIANCQKRLSVKPQEICEANTLNTCPVPRSSSPSQFTQSSDSKHPSESISWLKPPATRSIGNTSNMTTPLAQPIYESKEVHSDTAHSITEVTDEVHLGPSLMNPHHNRPHLHRGTSGDSATMFSMSTESEHKLSSAASLSSDNSKDFAEASPPSASAANPGRRHSSSSDHDVTMFASSYDAGQLEAHSHATGGSNATKDAAITAGLRHNDARPLATATDTGENTTIVEEMPTSSSAVAQRARPPVLPGTPVRVNYLTPAPPRSPPAPPHLRPNDTSPVASPPRLDIAEGADFELEDFLLPAPAYPFGGLESAVSAPGMLQQLVQFYIGRGEIRLASQLYILTAQVLTPFDEQLGSSLMMQGQMMRSDGAESESNDGYM